MHLLRPFLPVLPLCVVLLGIANRGFGYLIPIVEYHGPNGNSAGVNGNYRDNSYPHPSATVDHAPLSGGVGDLTDQLPSFFHGFGAPTWVGWSLTYGSPDPVVTTFELAAPRVVDSVEIDALHSPGAAIYLPGQITVSFSTDNVLFGNSVVYAPVQSGNYQTLTIPTPGVTAQYVRIESDYLEPPPAAFGGERWIFYNNVRVLPEPAAGLGLAGAGVLLLARRRR